MSNEKSLALRKELESNNFLEVFGHENYPVDIKDGINSIINIVAQNKSISDLYPTELQEIPVSTSIFQDSCVQMEQHFTPHRKLRQALMELESKLGALDSAKNGHRKALVKLQQLEEEIQELENIYDTLDKDHSFIDFDLGMLISTFSYNVKDGENTNTFNIIPESIINVLSSGREIADKKLISVIKNKIKTALGFKLVDYEEAKRGLKSAQHMIKDAAIKAYQYQKQAEQYKIEIENSQWSYEEAEVVWYVFYFTSGAEHQLRTGDHQIDRGTFGAISQLPDQIRRKVLDNISFIRNKLFSENYPIDGDYIWKTYFDELTPKKTGPGEFEGMKVKDFIKIEPIKLISKYKDDENI